MLKICSVDVSLFIVQKLLTTNIFMLTPHRAGRGKYYPQPSHIFRIAEMERHMYIDAKLSLPF